MGKLGNKVFSAGLFQAGIFHHVQDLGNGGFTVQLGGAQLQQAVAVHAAADDLAAGMHKARLAFAGKGGGVQRAFARNDLAVNGNFLAGAHDQHRADGHIVGINGTYRAVGSFQVGAVGADIHQIADALAAFADGVTLEQFANLVEQHNGNALTELTQAERSHSGNGHQKVFVKNFAVNNAQHSFAQHIVANDEVWYQEEHQLQIPGDSHQFGSQNNGQIQHR